MFLRDVWPTDDEIDEAHAKALRANDFSDAYADNSGGDVWTALDAPTAAQFPWDPDSTYLRRPPFVALPSRAAGPTELVARPLIVLGDDITTDHISPAGAIPAKGEAGAWLIERGENPRDLNVFSSRRGNFEAMVRGLYTNRAVRNLLAPDAAPGWTRHAPSGDLLPLYRAAERYRAEGTPTVILAGQHYGAGSSRDWGAKGPALLGVRAVLARQLRAHPPLEPDRHGHPAARAARGRHPASLALEAGRRDRLHHRLCRARAAHVRPGDDPPRLGRNDRDHDAAPDRDLPRRADARRGRPDPAGPRPASRRSRLKNNRPAPMHRRQAEQLPI